LEEDGEGVRREKAAELGVATGTGTGMETVASFSAIEEISID
jgi:hypothetical protein